MTLNVLFIGFKDRDIPTANQDEEFVNVGVGAHLNHDGYGGKYASAYYYTKIPTIYDYHIVFLLNPNDVRHNFKEPFKTNHLVDALKEKKSEITTFMCQGRIMCTFLTKSEDGN